MGAHIHSGVGNTHGEQRKCPSPATETQPTNCTKGKHVAGVIRRQRERTGTAGEQVDIGEHVTRSYSLKCALDEIRSLVRKNHGQERHS